MKIEEVLKEENVGKVYKFDCERYLLVKIGSFLCLKREKDGEDIDDIHLLCVLVEGRFREVID